jgi:AraC-like DNA-binding protein
MKSMLVSDVGWCKAMKDVFTQHGLDADALFAQAGLRTSEADMDLNELTDAFTRAWSLAASRTGNPAIGLTSPTHPLASLGVLSHVVLAAQDVRSALQSIARFTHLASPTASVEMRQSGPRCELVLQILPGRLPVAPQRFDHLAVTCARGLKWVTGRDLLPVVLHHPGPEPQRPELWREAFGCPVVFGADACVLELPADVLAQPIPTADPTVSDLCERIAAQIAEQQGGSVSARVRQVLVKHLSKGDPRRESVAQQLCMSERTLQRRLTEEGTSFAELLDEVRREAAERYFRQGDFTPTEITFALGFSDPSNFYRACKRWFGRSPGTMRCPD